MTDHLSGFVSYVMFYLSIIYLITVVLAAVFQDRLIFFPSRVVEITPKIFRLDYEEVEFPATDGELLSGWFVGHPNATYTILYCHGNAGNIGDRVDYLKIFHELELNCFIFDYHGYGNSSGKRPSQSRTSFDVVGAWEYLTKTKNIDPSTIILYGHSLGGGIAGQLFNFHQPRALILDSTFTSLREIARFRYPFFPTNLFLRIRYDTVKQLQTKVHCPVLVMHSRDDDLIPFEQGQKLFTKANKPKDFVALIGSHNSNFLESGEQYKLGLKRFIGSL